MDINQLNHLRLLLIILMGVLLLVWLLICTFIYFRKSKKVLSNLDFIVKVKCEKCNNEYDASPKEFVKASFNKQASVTKTKVKGPMLVNEPEFKYFFKKMDCPYCQKRVYGQILNMSEIQNKTRNISLRVGIQAIFLMILGGAIVIVCTMVPMKVIDHKRSIEIEKMKEELWK